MRIPPWCLCYCYSGQREEHGSLCMPYYPSKSWHVRVQHEVCRVCNAVRIHQMGLIQQI